MSELLAQATLAQAAARVRALTSEFCGVDWALLPLSTRGLLLRGIQRSQGVIPLQHCLVCGLPVHCVDYLTLITEAPTGWSERSFTFSLYSGCQSLLINGYEGRGVQTKDTRRICHPCCSRRGDGDVDRFPCIFLCRTLPELRTHISFPGVPLYGHPCWLPASPDACLLT